MQEGIIEIKTADLGSQWYMINIQPSDSRYLPGETLVSKVEPVRSLHEESAYKRNRWQIIRRLDGEESSFAHKAFGVLRSDKVAVFLQNHNSEQERLARELAAIRPRSAANGSDGIGLPSMLLWQNHGKIVEDFLNQTKDGSWHPLPELDPQRAE